MTHRFLEFLFMLYLPLLTCLNCSAEVDLPLDTMTDKPSIFPIKRMTTVEELSESESFNRLIDEEEVIQMDDQIHSEDDEVLKEEDKEDDKHLQRGKPENVDTKDKDEAEPAGLVVPGEGFYEEERGVFMIGRIPDGRFELPRLNGRMTKHVARDLCEENIDCGGFTFLGCIDEEKEYEVFFFSHIHFVMQDKGSYSWVYYQPSSHTEERLRFQAGLDNRYSYDLDLCCPAVSRDNEDKLFQEAYKYNSIQRVDCSIDQDTFEREFVLKEIPVIIENCTKEWPAQRSWTLKGLLQEKEGLLEWRSDLLFGPGTDANKFSSMDYPTGLEILDVMSKNGTIRVFDPIEKRHFKENPHDLNLDRQKLYLQQDYRAPDPVPIDWFQKARLYTDFQWIILSQKGTGTSLHNDPHITTAWNSLISGYKWWVVLPAHTDKSSLTCDNSCSVVQGDEFLEVNQWYTHVLPQLRDRVWYGKQVIEFIQKPGDTIYLPRRTPHAILNMEENVSVTENIFTIDALEEYISRVMTESMYLGYDDHEIFFKELYYRMLNHKQRNTVRNIMAQVEEMINKNPQICEEDEDDIDEDYDEDEDDDEDDDDDDDDDEEDNDDDDDEEDNDDDVISGDKEEDVKD